MSAFPLLTISAFQLLSLSAFQSPLPRCQLVPLPDAKVSFQVDGVERLAWHHADTSPRPFFFPFLSPTGAHLTRIGHPGAPDHNHHRSIWFAHHDVDGSDFWSDNSRAHIRQKTWLAYIDGHDECAMATLLHWSDAEGTLLVEQELIAALIPLDHDEHLLELQITLRPAPGRTQTTLGKTNFGLLAVRVAASLSEHFGEGVLSDSEGRSGEEQIFAERARWVDYSGPVPDRVGPGRQPTTAGITYFDHPTNPRHPSRWHVRADGWMGASLCMDDPLILTHEDPLTLRYLLHAHAGSHHPDRAAALFEAFSARPPFLLSPSNLPHRQWHLARQPPTPDDALQ